MTPGPYPVPDLVHLRALSSLTISISWAGGQVLPDWHMPDLRFVKVFTLRRTFVSKLLPFFDRYGSQLIGLHVRTDERVSSFDSILSRTSSLQSLVIGPTDLTMLRLMDDQSFPSLSHLGLQPETRGDAADSYAVDIITEDFRILFEKRTFPGLKYVRIFGVHDPVSFAEHWLKASWLCLSRNIILSGEE